MDSNPQPIEDDGAADMDRAFARLNNQNTTTFGTQFGSGVENPNQ